MELQRVDSGPGKKLLKGKKEDVQHKEDVSVGKNGPRKRVSQACDRCRSRKDKCDGKKPACSTCVTHGRACSYDANVKKRGLPEGYVRGLEKLWGLAIREVDGVEDTLLVVLGGEDSTETLVKVWNDDGPSDTLVETWRKSKISQELERLLPILEPSADAAKRKRADSDAQIGKRIGLSANQTQSVIPTDRDDRLSMLAKGWPERKPDIMPQDVPQQGPISLVKDERQILTARPTSVSSTTPIETSATPQVPNLPSDTWQLLDVYFSYTHCWLPIIEKHDLLRTSYQYSQTRANNDVSNLMSGDHAALWAAISYAKYQRTAAGPLSEKHDSNGDADWTAQKAYAHARGLVPDEEGAFQLGHVQALLILTLANMGLGYFSRAWILIGHAVRVAIDMGLDNPAYSGTDSSRSSLRSKHVFLGCFALETILAARLGRRPHLRSEDAAQIGQLNEDGLEEWDPWTDCLTARKGNAGSSRGPVSILSTFNRLIQVLQILNDGICTISNGSKKPHLTTNMSSGLLERLDIWKQSEPPQFSIDPKAMKNGGVWPLLPHHYHLHLAYTSTLSTSQLLSCRQKKEGSSFEQCASTARQVGDLLRHHIDSYELLIVPPTFEYFIKTAYDTIHEVQSSIESTHIVLDDWKYNMNSCINAMETAWPVFPLFKSSPSYMPVSKGRRESQVAFDLISGINHEAETPRSVNTPQTSASFEIANPFSPHVFRSQSMTGVERPQQILTVPRKVMAPPVSQRSGSFNASPSNIRPNMQQAAQALFNSQSPIPNDGWSMNSQTQQQTLINQHPVDMSRPLPSQFQHTASIGSDVESDSMFNEFAALDAMEWTDNWDQSLVNLGFTDPDNMNQDFYAMSREPDPLYPNTVFQQLLANSNAESSGVLDGPVFGEAHAQGFGEVGFGFSGGSEGIEAGQILQALSQAEEQVRLGRGSG